MLVKRRIIDRRRKEKFMVDDEYINSWAKICGWKATLVYMSLCRHSNISQESFPAITTMMEELKVGRNTILDGIRLLHSYQLITVRKFKNKKGRWQNNIYVLLDKSAWIKEPRPSQGLGNQVLEKTKSCPSQNKTTSSTRTLRKPIEGYTNKVKRNNIKKETFRKNREIINNL